LRPSGREASDGDGWGGDEVGVGARGGAARFGTAPATTSDRASALCGLPNTHSYAASLIPYISWSAGFADGGSGAGCDAGGASGAAANIRRPGASRVLAASSFGLRASVTDSASRPRRAERAA
jgi:hypothetical protein